MSRLQSDVKPHLLPLLRGERALLDAVGQTRVAAWAVMMAMVAEHFDRSKVAVSPEDRAHLMRTQLPPDNWKVWIGNYKREAWRGHWVHHPLPIYPEGVMPELTDEGLPRPNTQTTTNVVGQLYIHAASSAADVFKD